ncbi:MAG: hypothetical protein CES88_03635 [Halobacteriovorax sp. JY17]|nr:MAG: hypothetical protein CES88_03635 [Halobacteriovorax sp. JY17]
MLRIIAITISLFCINITDAMTISSFNIRNFEVDGPYSTNPNSLEKILKENISDIFAFQEIVDTENFKRILQRNLPNHKSIISKCGGYGRQKLNFVYDSRKFKVLDSKEDLGITGGENCNSGVRPLLKIRIESRETSEKTWALLVHLKAGANISDINFRKEQINYIQEVIRSLDNYFILGDFNTTQYFEESGEYFQNFVERNKLTHSSSQVECSSYWWGGISDGLYYPSLLDHILISTKLANKFERIDFSNREHCKINTCHISSESELGDSFNNVSDHCPIRAELKRK